jgi:hypothetical protein
MRTNKRYVGKQKRQTEGASAKIALLVLGVILLVAGLYFGIKIMAVRNSPDFDLNKTSVYYFVYPVSTSNIETVVGRQITNKLFIVNGEKRTIYVIDIPPTIFINSKKLDATKASPRDFLTYFIDLLALKPDYSYVVYQKEEFFKKLKVRDMNQLVETYSKRGLKFLDYLSLQSQITALRPESAITEAALAKFYYSLGTFSIESVQVPLLTTMPIKITVDGNVYYRTYLDEEKLNELVSIFNK